MTSDYKKLYFWNLHKKSIQDSLETKLERNSFDFWTTHRPGDNVTLGGLTLSYGGLTLSHGGLTFIASTVLE